MEGELVTLDDGVRDGLIVMDRVLLMVGVVDGVSVMVAEGLFVDGAVAEGDGLKVGDREGRTEAVVESVVDWVGGRDQQPIPICIRLGKVHLSNVKPCLLNFLFRSGFS